MYILMFQAYRGINQEKAKRKFCYYHLKLIKNGLAYIFILISSRVLISLVKKKYVKKLAD